MVKNETKITDNSIFLLKNAAYLLSESNNPNPDPGSGSTSRITDPESNNSNRKRGTTVQYGSLETNEHCRPDQLEKRVKVSFLQRFRIRTDGIQNISLKVTKICVVEVWRAWALK
jgi:hypothetical protein